MASTNVGSIHYDLSLKTDKFDAAAASIGTKTKKIGDSMQKVGKKMTLFVTLPVVAGMGFAVKAASDLSETLNKVDVSFGKQAKVVRDWSKTSINAMGLAQQSALDAAALFGDMATSMGLSQKAAANMSMGLVQLGADLASFKNISFEEAQTALAGVFTGETESLKRLGIVMTETNLEAFALSQGITTNIQDMTQAQKVQLRYAYIMSVTKNAQGDFARTSESTANQIRIMRERFKELSAQIGQKLIPLANKLMAGIGKLLDWFNKLSPATQNFLLILIAIVAVIGPMLIVIGALVSALGAIAAALGVGIAVAAGIVAAVVAAVIAIVAIGYLLIRNWNTIKAWFSSFWQFLQQMWDSIVQKVVTTWQSIYNTVKTFLTSIWNFISPILNFIKNIFTIVFGGILLLVIYYFKAYYNVISTVLRTLWGFISGIWNSIYNTISGVVKRLLNFFAPAFRWLYGRGREIISGLINGIKAMAGPLVSGVSAVSAKIGQFFKGAARWLWDTGRAIISGLIGGMASMAGAVYNKAQEIANGIKDRIKSALKIQSPSKVFYGFGENVVQGFINGIRDSKMAAFEAMNAITPVVNQPSPIAAAVGEEQVTHNHNYTINLEGIIARSRGDLREIGKDIVAVVNEELRAKSLPEIGK